MIQRILKPAINSRLSQSQYHLALSLLPSVSLVDSLLFYCHDKNTMTNVTYRTKSLFRLMVPEG